MTSRTSMLIAAVVLASSTACTKDKESSGGGTVTTVGIVASRASVVANGTNTVTLTVTDTQGGPVSVTTNRGTFLGGGQTATVTGASGTVTLVTCDAATNGCVGTATVTATHGSTATATVTFGSLAAMCSADCTVDGGCPGQACALQGGGTGSCSSTTVSVCSSAPACTPNPIGATTETSCTDGLDNDCDGATDCEETSCTDQACDPASATSFCKSGTCTDIASGLSLQLTPARTRLPANGTATTDVVVEVKSGAAPAAGLGVTISTSLGALSAATGTTGADGKATFTFTASATPGVATITAFVTGIPSVARTATVTMPALGSLSAGAVQYPVQGVIGSGWNEFGFVSVVVLDDAGQPYPDGLAVRFEHRRLGGSTLGAPLTADTASCLAASGCVGHLGATSSGSDPADTVGLAAAQLYSGTVAGTLTTTASTTAGGVTRTVTLPTVAVVGARANGANLSVVCSPRNVPALAETDCAISLVDAPITCEALLKDRYNNLLGTATQVIFASEAAAVGQVTTTPAYDPENPAPDLGVASQIFQTLGAGLPFDVIPDAVVGEPFVDHGLDGCDVRTHNPRDGVVTILAIADGEEAFFDSNGNGTYDTDEPYVDQGEPFVDQDDNGVWDAGEWFLDVDGDGLYTVGNLAWDSATKIWTQTVVVYTGTPATLLSGTDLLGTRWVNAADFAGSCDPTPVAADFALSQGGPLSEPYVVVASDMNLNMLTGGTTYGVAVVTGSITAEYTGLPSYADDLGLFYRYWPCDQTGACASQCRSAGPDSPCVMTPSVFGYGCGVAAGVNLVAGTTPDPGTDVVDWDVSTPYDVLGTAKTMHVKRRLTGQSLP